jgi:hypothetical protein
LVSHPPRLNAVLSELVAHTLCVPYLIPPPCFLMLIHRTHTCATRYWLVEHPDFQYLRQGFSANIPEVLDALWRAGVLIDAK